MGLNCGCPAAAALSDLQVQACSDSVGQIQKIYFQRRFASAGVLNTIPAGSGIGGIEVKATWTALLVAADSTKVLVSPYIQGPTVEAGAAKVFGGGNATLGGVEVVIGREHTTFEAQLFDVNQITVEQMKKLQCEDAGVYLIDEYGKIICLADDLSAPTTFYPIPIGKFFVGDKKLGGLDEPDTNLVQWSFYPNWSDKLAQVTPSDFDPLTELA